MGYFGTTTVDVDIEAEWIDDIWGSFSMEDKKGFVGDYYSDFEDIAPELFVRPEYDLSDPVVLLGVITALRDLGYSVEPGA